MKVFNHHHFLRYISMPTLREFTQGHLLGSFLNIDWDLPKQKLPDPVNAAVSALEDECRQAVPGQENEEIVYGLQLWRDDLRRAHAMSDESCIKELVHACANDQQAQLAFAALDRREQALWMLIHRDQAFRDAELHVAFQAKANGRYWKKHRIQPNLELTADRAKLEGFCAAVAKLYKKEGAGDGVHVEISQHSMGSVQLTIYVEGPVTALAHFARNHFKRITTRLALEAALVYQPATGFVETIVKGGTKNHAAVLKLFGQHVLEHDINPQCIEKTRYQLNALRDSMLEPYEDWSIHGVEKVRLRRAKFTPVGSVGHSFQVEVCADKNRDDSVQLAQSTLKTRRSFEAEYNMVSACLIVYTLATARCKESHFSFDVCASGSSTIKNLSERNQPIALAVLKALNVIESDEILA